MELQGKALIEFEKYLITLRKHNTDRKFADIDLTLHHQGYEFEDLPDSMKYGVYVDWFDSVGITVGLFTYTAYSPILYRGYAGNKTCESSNTRLEARTAAIQKANELFNNK